MKKKDTIKSLEKKTVELRSGKVIVNSSDLARDNYRAFLDLVSDDPALRAEAMRRLGDLELEATEAAQLADENIESRWISQLRQCRRSSTSACSRPIRTIAVTTPCCISSPVRTRSAAQSRAGTGVAQCNCQPLPVDRTD